MGQREMTVRGRELGGRLRAVRESAGLRQYQVARRLGVSRASMCRIEDGRRTASPEEVAALLMLYRVTGPAKESLLALAREVSDRGWWRRRTEPTFVLDTLVTLESRAVTITSFQTSVIPGLLQTPLYTAALLREYGTIPEDDLPRAVRARGARCTVLFRRNPAHLLAVIEETALHRAPGSAAVLHRQLDYLLHVAEQPNVSLRIIPADCGVKVSHIGEFHLMRFSTDPAVVHTENWGSSLYYEDPADIEHYDDAVRRLLTVSLGVEDSIELIARLRATLEADPDVSPHLVFPPLEEEQS